MKSILLFTLALLISRVHGEVASAQSGVFVFDGLPKPDSRSTSSAEFVLDTMSFSPGTLEVTGPNTVVGASSSPLQILWHTGATQLDVSQRVDYRFLTPAPAGTAYGPGVFHAGEVTVPTTVQVVFWYCFDTNGHSQESAPFSITITPRLRGILTAARQGTSGGVVDFTATIQGGSGSNTIAWDTDGDGQYDDGSATTVSRNYGTATGTFKAGAQVSDGAGGVWTGTVSITLNKAPVANQPVADNAVFDPGGFQLYLPDAGNSPFVFDSSRKSGGLVVITHGYQSDAKQAWLRDMGQAIERRCIAAGTPRPNIALLDWSQMAGNPLPVTLEAREIINGMIAQGGGTGYNPVKYAGHGINAADFLAELYGLRVAGWMTGQLLANWVYLNARVGGTPQIDPESPLQFIGHSVGGLAAGEAARLLKHPHLASWQPVYVDRVTMLDTPLPPKPQLAEGADGFPNPGVTERCVSSIYGAAETWSTFGLPQTAWYGLVPVFKSSSPLDLTSPYESGHGWAYRWFTERTTDPLGPQEDAGFRFSPIINAGTRIAKPYTPTGLPFPAPELPDIVPSGWLVFGNAIQSAGIWELTESSDAGIWKAMTLPQTAASLAFEFHFSNAGEGDFLTVSFGDDPVLYQGLDLALSRAGWLPVEIPLDLLSSLNGKLVFTLVSRGSINAKVQLRNIRITQSPDPDADGLAAAGEAAANTDPRNPDTDGDGISDGDEVNTHGTDPLRADSDGDGQDDPAELAAGTNPLLNGSLLRVTSVAKTGQGFSLQWAGAVAKKYRIRRSQELGTGNHETIAFGVPGVAPVTSFTDPNPPPGRAFYWVEVE